MMMMMIETVALHLAHLQQDTPALVASCSTQATCMYYTDGLVGERDSVGTTFVCRPLIAADRLAPYTTPFQAEVATLLLAL